MVTGPGLNGRCPNLIPTQQEIDVRRENSTNRNATVTFAVTAGGPQCHHKCRTEYESLADMWSKWNGEYLHTDIPRLKIRMEDMIFCPHQVMAAITECIGVNIADDNLAIHSGRSKDMSNTTLLTAMQKYGI